ncbi:MAG: FHA domain-containing protein [Lachnospiraceae bacterium]|nr:FHA domain-containing protein [Lachnospiraceae bacterium]
MEVSYKRTSSTSYMIIKGYESPAGYVEEMLRENNIRSLIPFFTSENNGENCYWYDISGKISLEDYLKRTGMIPEILKKVFKALSLSLEELRKYLIPERNICTLPKCIYLKEAGEDIYVYLCFLPESGESGLIPITEYLIGAVDHSKETERSLCYDLYELSMSSEATLNTLTERVEKDMAAKKDIPPEYDESDRCIQIHSPAEMDSYYSLSTAVPPAFDAPAEVIPPVITKAEKKPSMFQKLIDCLASSLRCLAISHITGEKREGIIKKMKRRHSELFPEKDNVTDLIYEPTDSFYEPTLMLKAPTKQDQKAPEENICCEGILIPETPGDKLSEIRITGERFSIGSKAEENDALIAAPSISRHHALITLRDGSYYLEDMNSTNGTYVNDRMLSYHEAVRLGPSDRIRFANLSYRFK